jgi:hypothetical protein
VVGGRDIAPERQLIQKIDIKIGTTRLGRIRITLQIVEALADMEIERKVHGI